VLMLMASLIVGILSSFKYDDYGMSSMIFAIILYCSVFGGAFFITKDLCKK